MARMAVARPSSIQNSSQLHSQSNTSNTSSSHVHQHTRTSSHQIQSLSKNGNSNSVHLTALSKVTANVPTPPMTTNSNQNTPILGGSKPLLSSSASSSYLKNGISSGSSSSHSAAAAAAAVAAAFNFTSTNNTSSSAAAPSPLLSSNSAHLNGNFGAPNGIGNGGNNININNGGGPTFNTELRAQMRREREATREKSREKMNGNPHNNNNGGGVNGGGVGITTTSTTTTSGALGGNVPAHQINHTSSINHHHHSSNQTIVSGRDRSASSATIIVGNAQINTSSNSSNSTDRKISPKMNTKAPHLVNSNASSSSLHNSASQNYHTTQPNSSVVNRNATQQRSNVSLRNGPPESQSLPPSKDSVSNQSTPDFSNFCENLPSLQGIEDIIARIPSPPRPNQDDHSQPMDQSTLFVKQYYALLEKCQSWQRYATNMKARADSFEIENRYLRETNRKHEEDVRALELQLRGLKETAMILEEERRRSEDRHGRYVRPTLRHPSTQPVRRPSEVLESAMASVPSPPALMDERDQMNTHRFPSQESRASSDIREMEAGLDLRPPTSLSNLSMPSSLRNAIRQNDAISRPGSYRSYDATEQYYGGGYANAGHLEVGTAHNSHNSSHDSNINDILYQDAQNRDAAAAMYEAHQQHAAMNRQREIELSESHSFPPSDITKSKALTVQTLAAANRERKEAAKMNRLPSSSSAPILRQSKDASSSDKQFSPPQRILRHQNSESTAGLRADQGKNFTGVNQHQHNADVAAQLQGLLRAPNQADGRLSTVPGSRSGSVQSDAMTITEEYLQGVVEQKRQLRKISLSQQQQLHFLQARVHLSNDATIGSRTSVASVEGGQDKENVVPTSTSGGLSSAASFPGMTSESSGRNSRPSSRMSNRGVRGKVRSRAGSHSLHDAIPIDKNDVFSSHSGGELSDPREQGEHRAIRRTGSAPLGQVNLNGNRSGAMSALELRHMSGPSDSDVSLDLEEERERIRGVNNASFGVTSAVIAKSGSEHIENEESESDPKGAHRRLYMRLRDELSTEELVKFERYVHRYDALDLEMDGPKGIINRVRRLLLSEEILESKFTKREKYQFRKELAREFERIVREDAVPTDGTTEIFDNSIQQQQQQQTANFETIQPLQFNNQQKRSPEQVYQSP